MTERSSDNAPDCAELSPSWAGLRAQLDEWATELGFQQLGITGVELAEHEQRLQQWLAAGYHGDMVYMADHGNMRSRPAELLPGTLRVISVRMDYLAPDIRISEQLSDKNQAYISRYALGRDYHKLVRKRLTELGKRLQQAAGEMGFRAFVDSAPVLERALANQAGLGWIGKNTMLINRKAGSYFFLGEILTDLPLPMDKPYTQDHCGRCTACLDICPTQAFVGPHVLDARRCISYLTIELNGPIPEDLRPGIGNRIFGCDDCQIGCPWNRFSNASKEGDFSPRHQLDKASLLELFAWNEATFLSRTEGMPIRRTGYENWLRNIAVALGNAPRSLEVTDALQRKRPQVSALVQEHIDWALQQQQNPR
ncbi:tRNA epoxyqueuosine(34) reductase QueG [Thalassolituus pacificus]|uniref:Epoxyqueuosine reductase n=1 Tax=Thalassolituus pacificus TaxID=2975440 RepID=A0A9X3AST6_9GAMM|nr:tRNA epoxyqueuosine(34) reductase QueG [Thalassolituus pacificus]MCT7360394.1 tRNA epoxyqueuosine(34) reductase QueG [Thalassolituus pacificus]